MYRTQRRKELLKRINELNFGIEILDIDKLYYNIEKELNVKNRIKQLSNEFFELIERYKSIFEIDGFNCNIDSFNEYTISIGYILA